MTVRYNESGDLVYIDKKGNEIEIDINCMSCNACYNTHLEFCIPVLGFISSDIRYFGEIEDFDDYPELNKEIEDYLSERQST